MPKKSVGAACSAHDQCAGVDNCRNGYCCDNEMVTLTLTSGEKVTRRRLRPGCIGCNTRGYCSLCGAGFSICGKSLLGYGQCAIASAAMAYGKVPASDALTKRFSC